MGFSDTICDCLMVGNFASLICLYVCPHVLIRGVTALIQFCFLSYTPSVLPSERLFKHWVTSNALLR